MARKEKEADRAWRLAYYQAQSVPAIGEPSMISWATSRVAMTRSMWARAVIKMAAFNAYGGPRCACCGETLIEGLGIDHINGDGGKHRTDIGGGGHNLYRWLQKNNYPPGYQVLCYTCNCAKRTGDHCPHQDMWI